MNTYDIDVLIIGAGPVGIFSAYQARFLGMTTLIVDSLSEIGGQLNALYPLKNIYDIPAYPEILATDLIKKLKLQANRVGHEDYLMDRFVSDLKKNDDGTFTVTTSTGDSITSKTVIVAAGAGAFGPNRPPLENIENFENKSVFYFVKNPLDYQDKTVVIAGGGDSAVDWAVGLSAFAKKIYVVHRRDNFRAVDATVSEMREISKTGKIELVIPYQLSSLQGEDGMISSVIVKTLKGEERILDADILLPFFGLSRDLGDLAKWGFDVDTTHNTIKAKPLTYETSIDGIFAVGDVADYEHKLKLISLGFSEATMALHSAWKYVFPDRAFHFVHSTSK